SVGGVGERENFQVCVALRATREIQQACVHSENKSDSKYCRREQLCFAPDKLGLTDQISRRLKARL
ncbi:MAG TPA: hypothetical protein VF634_03115, partial [Pyrinomonadaceae bacterium]